MHFCSLVSRFAVIGLKINVIQTIHHALESDTYKFSPLTVWLDRHTCPLYTKTILLTQADKKVLHKWKHKIHVVPNPVTFTPLEKLPIKDNIILAAGRLDDWKYKGWDILINAAHTIAETLREKKWVIKIAGNGSTESVDLLKKMCQEKDVSDIVQFIGYQNDMQSLYKRASIFLLSSRSEGLPMVLIEAMSQGCACVATDFKGRTREIITSDEEGLLAAPEDYKSLAHHIDFLINNENKRSLIQQNAIARSMYYGLDNILNKWENILNTLYKSEN